MSNYLIIKHSTRISEKSWSNEVMFSDTMMAWLLLVVTVQIPFALLFFKGQSQVWDKKLIEY